MTIYNSRKHCSRRTRILRIAPNGRNSIYLPRPIELTVVVRARMAILLELEGRQVRVVLKEKSASAV
jgi:hypothetical protein